MGYFLDLGRFHTLTFSKVKKKKNKHTIQAENSPAIDALRKKNNREPKPTALVAVT